MRELNAAFRINREDIPFIVACTLIGWLLGVAMVLVIMHFFFEPGDGYATFGVLFGVIGAFVGILSCRNQNGHTRFFLALSMGQTRRGYLLWDSLLKLVETALVAAMILGLGFLESRLYLRLYPEEEDVLNFTALFLSRRALLVVLGTAVGLVVLNLVFTAVMARFGQKGFLFFFAPIWAISLIVAPALNASEEQTGSILAWIGDGLRWIGAHLSDTVGIVALIGITVLMAVASVWYLLRAPVKL